MVEAGKRLGAGIRVGPHCLHSDKLQTDVFLMALMNAARLSNNVTTNSNATTRPQENRGISKFTTRTCDNEITCNSDYSPTHYAMNMTHMKLARNIDIPTCTYARMYMTHICNAYVM